MRAQSYLMWLAHAFPAVAITLTAPAQSTPSSTPVSDCSSVNLIEDAPFETIDLEDSVWTILPPKGGVTADECLHLSPQAVESQALLVQTITGVVAEETYTFSFDLRTTVNTGRRTTCLGYAMLNGDSDEFGLESDGTWKTLSKQWTPRSSEVDIFVAIFCPGAVASGTAVDVKNFSLKKPCGSSSKTSASVPIQTPSASVYPSDQPIASGSSSSSIKTGTVSVPSSHSSSVHVSPVSPSSTTSPAYVELTSSSPTGTPSPEMTTSTIYATRTSTITACPSAVTHCPANEQTTYITTETIVVSTTVCPVEDATTTVEGPSPTGPSGHGNDNGSANSSGTSSGNDSSTSIDYTISTILSTRTMTLTECPATVTDCPARDQTTYVTTETIVAGTTSMPIRTTVTTTAFDGVQTTTVPQVGGNGSENGSEGSTGEGSTNSDSGSGTEAGFEADSEIESGSSGSGVSAGHGAGPVSRPPRVTPSMSASPSFSLIRISSATVKVPVATSSPTAVNAGAGAGSNPESSNPPSASPVFNGASAFASSSVVSAVGIIAALALVL